MGSTFSWLDYSERERRTALDVIDLFRQPETLDELGIGPIRDAFADLFFPGTSTIQTRAAYFLFIPWTYVDLEKQRVPSRDIARRARYEELRLVDELARAEDHQGVIGIEARKSLKRLPSSVYWRGLNLWGIRLFTGSQDQYHRSLDTFYRVRAPSRRTDDQDWSEGSRRANWHPNLPDPPPGFPRQSTLSLRSADATYLKERVFAYAPRTLLAFLLDEGERSVAPFPWDHHQTAVFTKGLADQLAHAQRFSEVVHGAALLYNLMLAEALGNEDWRHDYLTKLESWGDRIDAARWLYASWDLRRFWEVTYSGGARIPRQTQSFAEDWLTLVVGSPRAFDVVLGERARRLIHERELAVKRGRARLHNKQALALWQGASGTDQIDFRWRQARTIVNDILAGVSSGA